jgi:plastocyanin
MMGVVEVVKTITIQPSAIDPVDVPLTLGSTVIWTNLGDGAYTIAADDGSFNSGPIAPRQAFAYTFDVPGSTAYRCLATASESGAPASVPLAGVVKVSGERSVDITDSGSPGTIAFHPPTLQYPPIVVGTTVVWTNRDTVPHTVTAVDATFASGPIEPLGTFAHTFGAAGEVAYVGDVPAERHPMIEVRPPRPVATVWITSSGFDPVELYIPPGTQVIWTNRAGAVHSVTADHAEGTPPAFDSFALDYEMPPTPDFQEQPLIPGQRFSHRFEVLGTVRYHSTTAVDPPLTGVVHVATPVDIIDFAFVPEVVEIAAGTTIYWVNRAATQHTVSAAQTAYAGDPVFASDALTTGDRFAHTFLSPGKYTYRCAIHPDMEGTVVVT